MERMIPLKEDVLTTDSDLLAGVAGVDIVITGTGVDMDAALAFGLDEDDDDLDSRRAKIERCSCCAGGADSVRAGGCSE
eukprot:m.493586 g.493586  ORF g.493586 m.493586 type:complete len:79 (-) comp57286_c0_seq5:1996-2232(-)